MIAKIFSIGMNNCIQCGSFDFRPSLLCLSCETTLFQVALNSASFKSEVRKVPCLSLLRWQRDRNRILNRISLALKGPDQQSAWKYYAERFTATWAIHEKFNSSAVLVPCPSLNGSFDHAYWFAKGLSEITGIPVITYLKRVDAKEQKHLTRLERQKSLDNKFEMNQNVREKFSQVYFVDDIVTSGTTVLAAQYHLKKLGHVKALSLIIRE